MQRSNLVISCCVLLGILGLFWKLDAFGTFSRLLSEPIEITSPEGQMTYTRETTWVSGGLTQTVTTSGNDQGQVDKEHEAEVARLLKLHPMD